MLVTRSKSAIKFMVCSKTLYRKSSPQYLPMPMFRTSIMIAPCNVSMLLVRHLKENNANARAFMCYPVLLSTMSNGFHS
ncbi:hypothetical protein Ddc_18842 [Ditylenchus destructor]|nr:hypothetical protein Ddc_18842 [Ditylenchus destructor]